MNNRRTVNDRRAFDTKQDQAHACNRRNRPCRRLNNISVEEIPVHTINRHPILWHMFHKNGCEST